MPDYVYAVETDDFINIRQQPDPHAEEVGQANAGIRMMAAEEVQGGEYGGSRPGSTWYPVQYESIEGYIAAGYAHLV